MTTGLTKKNELTKKVSAPNVYTRAHNFFLEHRLFKMGTFRKLLDHVQLYHLRGTASPRLHPQFFDNGSFQG